MSRGYSFHPENRERPNRRQLLALSAVFGGSVLSGCLADAGEDQSDDSEDEVHQTQNSQNDDDESELEENNPSNFRLLISDDPADIGDFDSLEVTLESARVFPGDPESSDTQSSTNTTPNDQNDSDDRQRGFFKLDLDEPTVDLTDVIGDVAMPVFEGSLEPGHYRRVDLSVATIEGFVEGELAEVKVPSERLQINHAFEIRDGETTGFVFDINVVQRGQGARYNLTPVISDSGVAGEDVEVEILDPEEESPDDSESTPESDTANEGNVTPSDE